MLWTDIVLIIVLIAGFIVYFSAKRQLRQGNLQGWLKWAEPFIQVNRTSSFRTTQQTTSAGLSAEIIAALDNLYREFIDETTAIREEMAVQIDDLRAEFAAKLAALETLSVPTEPVATRDPKTDTVEQPAVAAAVDSVAPAVDERSTESSNDEEMAQRRFEILDLLVQGFSADAIARQLNIGVAEVQLVEQLMRQPNS